MSTISFNRSAHQHIPANLHCGKPKARLVRPSSSYCTQGEFASIVKAVELLENARNASSKASFLTNLSAAFVLIRDIAKDHS